MSFFLILLEHPPTSQTLVKKKWEPRADGHTFPSILFHSPHFLSTLWNRHSNQGNCQLARTFQMVGETFNHPEPSLRCGKRSGFSETLKALQSPSLQPPPKLKEIQDCRVWMMMWRYPYIHCGSWCCLAGLAFRPRRPFWRGAKMSGSSDFVCSSTCP